MCRFELDNGLVVSQLTLEDTEELFTLVDRNRTYLRQWLDFLDATQTPRDTRNFIEAMIELHARTRACTCALRVHGDIVGVIAHYYIDWQNRYAHLGYWLAEDRQGRGLMTRACAAFVEHSFTELDLNRVELTCASGNIRSQAVAVRLGFIHEGMRRESEWLYDRFLDHELYGLLRAEWQSHHKTA